MAGAGAWERAAGPPGVYGSLSEHLLFTGIGHHARNEDRIYRLMSVDTSLPSSLLQPFCGFIGGFGLFNSLLFSSVGFLLHYVLQFSLVGNVKGVFCLMDLSGTRNV